MSIQEKELIQSLVNALSRGRRYIYQAGKESFRADEVYEETMKALELAANNGYICNVEEKENSSF